jgi:predicted RNase H-like nuclease (RuvC/YqgF family)
LPFADLFPVGRYGEKTYFTDRQYQTAMAKNLKDVYGNYHNLDERAMDALVKALQRENLPGFDYLEFKQSLDALYKIGMDEDTAVKSAFATASTVGLTKEKLLKTAQHYKKVLLDEKASFEQSMQRHLQQRVQGKLEEVEKLKKKVTEYQAKIEQLQAQIAKYNTTIEQADSTIAADKERIEATRAGFETTLQSIVNDIDRDIERIEDVL